MGTYKIIFLSLLVFEAIFIIIIAVSNTKKTSSENLEQFDKFLSKRISPLRYIAAFYFRPKQLEILGKGFIYKILGVHIFGKIVPTGGLWIRKITGLKLYSWRLERASRKGARLYQYKSCAYELIHLTALIYQLPEFTEYTFTGQWGALADLWWNIPVNIYTLMLQRYNRARIRYILNKYKPK